MQDTSIYLDQLETDRKTLIANLTAKGVATEATETFTTLVPKVLEIAGGTGGNKSAYLVKNGTAMNAISDMKEGDVCVVLHENITPLTSTTKFLEATFHNEVTLDETVTDNVSVIFSNEGGEPDGDALLNATRFSFHYYSSATTGEVIDINYNSTDGIHYIREDKNGNPIQFDTKLSCDEASTWDERLAKFIDVVDINFEGIYRYEDGAWALADTDSNAEESHVYPGKRAYSDKGVVVGTLMRNVKNGYDFIEINRLLAGFDTSAVTDFTKALQDETPSLPILSLLNTSNATSFKGMFSGSAPDTLITSFTIDASKLDTKKVKTFEDCFTYSRANNIDISGWDFSSATTLRNMFYGLKLPFDNIKLPATVLTATVEDIRYMFYSCINFTSIDLHDWDFSHVTDMDGFVGENTNLVDINFGAIENDNPVTTSDMFINCAKLATISNMGQWKLSHIAGAVDMFSGCQRLNFVDMSNCTLVAADARGMFANMPALTSIAFPNFSGYEAKISTTTGYAEYLQNIIKGTENIAAASLETLLTNLPTVSGVTDAKYTSLSLLGMKEAMWNNLTTSEKKVATDKGWTAPNDTYSY